MIRKYLYWYILGGIVLLTALLLNIAESKEMSLDDYVVMQNINLETSVETEDYWRGQYIEQLVVLEQTVQEFAKAKATTMYYDASLQLATSEERVPTEYELSEAYYSAGGDSLVWEQIIMDLNDKLFGDIDNYNGPDSLYYVCLLADGCYTSQMDSQHFASNNYLAVDIGTGGQSINVRAPDYLGKELWYDIEYVYYPDTTGKTIELYSEYEGVKIMWRIGHLHYTEGAFSKVETGDIIATSGGEPDDETQGATTGMHIHLEFLVWDGEKYAPTPYRIDDSINVHTPSVDNLDQYGLEFLTTFYLSGYNAGDENQNYGSPCTSASGADICQMLEEGKQVIAMTSDQRSEYGVSFGDIVYLDGLSEYGYDFCDGYYYVEDEMNERYRTGCITSSTSGGYCIKGDVSYPYGERAKGCIADVYEIL